MKFKDKIKYKWQDLKSWYTEIAELLAQLLKLIIIYLPAVIIGIIGLFAFVFVAMKIGWWVIPIYVVLLILGFVIYERYIKTT